MKKLWIAITLLAGVLVMGCGDDNESTTNGTDSGITDTASSSDSETGSANYTDTGTGTEVDVVLEPKMYGPDTPQIQYVGRIDFTSNSEGPEFSGAGTYIKAKFYGTGVTVHIHDQILWGKGNYYDVYVDDMEPVKIKPELQSVTDFPVVSDLEAGEHTVMLVKRNEDEIGRGMFLGFTFVGEILEPDALPEHKIQIFGDSISSGTGVEAANNSDECIDWEFAMNAHYSFGAVAARSLGAQYHITARAGIGVTQCYDPGAPTMPEVYNLLHVQDHASGPVEWDMTSWVPDAVVLALGTNDFSPGPDPIAGDTDAVYPRPTPTPQEFAVAYIALVDNLLAVWPDAHFFGVSSQMLGDGWPLAENTYRQDQLDALALIKANYTGGNFHIVQLAKQAGTGCGTHPNVDQQAASAALLETAMREVLTDWQ